MCPFHCALLLKKGMNHELRTADSIASVCLHWEKEHVNSSLLSSFSTKFPGKRVIPTDSTSTDQNLSHFRISNSWGHPEISSLPPISTHSPPHKCKTSSYLCSNSFLRVFTCMFLDYYAIKSHFIFIYKHPHMATNPNIFQLCHYFQMI